MLNKRLKIAFLWHMHQPYYKDDVSGTIMMPWVFLHAIKDYYEILWHVERYQKVRATFNLVPSLLVQLKEYAKEDVKDRFLTLWKEEFSRLAIEDRGYLIRSLFHAKPETMIRPLSRYHELFLQKERVGIDRFIEDISESDLIDLEVLYILAWCGEYLRENNELVKELIKKGRDFDRAHKMRLLAELRSFISTIIERYKELQIEGKIEISTTPFYHPILPLLVDMESGVMSNKHLPIPNFKRDLYNDAKTQIGMAIEYYEETFGIKPRGFWPSEGSVSNEVLEILSEHGIRWCASDEDILFKTLKSRDKQNIYNRFRLNSYGREIDIYFRDKCLSDMVGFNYSRVSASGAVDDFLKKLKDIYQSSKSSQVVPVILDGENAWEYYDSNGRYFFEELYSRLEGEEWCEFVTFDEVSTNTEAKHLDSIEPGSWINGDFGVWLGEPEENRAWNLLKSSRDFLEHNRDRLESHIYQKAYKEILIAEGSDWFWWYGSDHYTPIKDEYDALFLKHLRNVYEICGEKIPEILYEPIFEKNSTSKNSSLPLYDLDVSIDGSDTYFFEWVGAGVVENRERFSTMSSSDRFFGEVKYGKKDEDLYIAIFGKKRDRGILEIESKNGGLERIRIDLSKESVVYRYKEFYELVIKSIIKGDNISISMKLIEDGILRDQVSTEMVDLDFDYCKNWFI